MVDPSDLACLQSLCDRLLSAATAASLPAEPGQAEDTRHCLKVFLQLGQYLAQKLEKQTTVAEQDYDFVQDIVNGIVHEAVKSESREEKEIEDELVEKTAKNKVKNLGENKVKKTVENNIEKSVNEAENLKALKDKKNLLLSENLLIKLEEERLGVDVKLKCVECPFSAALEQNRSLQLHFQKDHQGFNYPCRHCKFVSQNYEVLQGHTKQEHRKPVPLACQVVHCGYSTLDKKEFRKHRKIVHKNKKIDKVVKLSS